MLLKKTNLIVDTGNVIGLTGGDPLRKAYDSGWDVQGAGNPGPGPGGPAPVTVMLGAGNPLSYTGDLEGHDYWVSDGGRRKVLINFNPGDTWQSIEEGWHPPDDEHPFGRRVETLLIFGDPLESSGYTEGPAGRFTGEWAGFLRSLLDFQDVGILDHAHQYGSPLSPTEVIEVGADIPTSVADVQFDYNFYSQRYENVIGSYNSQIEQVCPNMYFFYLDSVRWDEIFGGVSGPFEDPTRIVDFVADERYQRFISLNDTIDRAWVISAGSLDHQDRSRYFRHWADTLASDGDLADNLNYNTFIIPNTTLGLLQSYNAYSGLFPMFSNIEFRSDTGNSDADLFFNSPEQNYPINNLMRDVYLGEIGAGGLTGIWSDTSNFAENHERAVGGELSSVGDIESHNIFDLNGWILTGGLTGLGPHLAAEWEPYLDKTIFMKNFSDDGYEDDYLTKPEMTIACNNILPFLDLDTGDGLRTYKDLLGENGGASARARSARLFFKINKYRYSGEFRSSEPMQTFFLPNNAETLTTIRLIDTQLRYSNEYEYEIFAYSLVVGSETRFRRVEIFGEGEEGWGEEFLPERVIDGYQGSWSTPGIGGHPDAADSRFPFWGTLSFDLQPDAPTPFIGRVEVETVPSIKLIEVPYMTPKLSNETFGRGTLLDDPPMPPEVSIIPYRGMNDRLLFNLNTGIGSREFNPIVFTREEAEYVNRLRNNNLPLQNAVLYENDDPCVEFEIRRLSTLPTSITDFADARKVKISTESEETGFRKMASTSFIDVVRSNTKYYYLFRAMDIHEHISHPTSVYEVELVENEGAVFPRIRIVQVGNAREDISRSKKLRRFLQIKPQLSHIIFNQDQADADYSEDGEIPTTAPLGESIPMGVNDVSLWGKQFKIRLTSKKSGKKIDLNLSFNKEFEPLPVTGVVTEDDGGDGGGSFGGF